jgi:hypothetical protein
LGADYDDGRFRVAEPAITRVEEDGMAETDYDEQGLFEIIHTTRSMRRLKPDPVPEALIRRIL